MEKGCHYDIRRTHQTQIPRAHTAPSGAAAVAPALGPTRSLALLSCLWSVHHLLPMPTRRGEPMSTILDQPVSLFAGAKATDVVANVPLGEVLERIRSGVYQKSVARVQQARARGEKPYRAAKEQLVAFTPC